MIFAGGIPAFIAENDDRQRGGKAETGRHRQRSLCDFDMSSLQQIERAHRQHEHRAGDVTGADGVNEFGLRDRIEQHGCEIRDFHPHGVGIELGSDRKLHPPVRDQNPKRREIRTQRDKPGHTKMLKLCKLFPPKKEQSDKSRLKEERHQPLDCERRSEYIADIVTVVSPIHAELKFHGDAGGNAHGEIDAEQQSPEFRHFTPDDATRHHVNALHDAEQHRETQSQRHKQKMIKRGETELQARKLDHVHGCHLGRLPVCETELSSRRSRTLMSST